MSTPAHATPDRPEPVINAAKLAGAVAAALIAIAGVLQVLGVVLPFNAEQLADRVSAALLAAAGLWAVAGPWLTARQAREVVTPLVDPVDASGAPLYPDLPGQHAAPGAR